MEKGEGQRKTKNKQEICSGVGRGMFLSRLAQRTESGRQEHEKNSTNRSHRSIACRGRRPKLCANTSRRLAAENRPKWFCRRCKRRCARQNHEQRYHQRAQFEQFSFRL